jgi:uncharacterized membrane protein
MRMRLLSAVFCIAVVVLCTGCPRSNFGTPHYTAEKTGVFAPDYSPSMLNESGAVVGFAEVGAQHRAVVWQYGETTPLEGPDPAMTLRAYVIADSGEILGTGSKTLPNPSCHYLLWSSGVAQSLYESSELSFRIRGVNDSLYAVGTVENIYDSASMAALFPPDGEPVLLDARRGSAPADINNSGEIVGAGTLAEGQVWGALLWNQKGAIRLDAPLPSGANAINDRGTIVGWFTGDSIEGGHACLWRNRKFESLATPEEWGSIAYDINNKGWIVGSTVTLDYTFEAALWRPRPMGRGYEVFKLQDAAGDLDGWRLTRAVSINDRGQILVQAEHQHDTMLILLTPARTGSSH